MFTILNLIYAVSLTAIVAFLPSESMAQSCFAIPGNIISNPSFEGPLGKWTVWQDGRDRIHLTDDASDCQSAATVITDGRSQNVQLYQAGLKLKANTDYLLKFSAKSSLGSPMTVLLHKHRANFRNYGLKMPVSLTDSWQEFETVFRTRGFQGSTGDGRLRFWLVEGKEGEVYSLDNIILIPLDDGIIIGPDFE